MRISDSKIYDVLEHCTSPTTQSVTESKTLFVYKVRIIHGSEASKTHRLPPLSDVLNHLLLIIVITIIIIISCVQQHEAGRGEFTASLSREGNQTDDWREPRLHVSMPLQSCTVIFTAHCSKRKEKKGEIRTAHST